MSTETGSETTTRRFVADANDEDLLTAVRECARDHRRPPTTQLMDADGRYPARAIKRRFECDWAGVLRRAGLRTRRQMLLAGLRRVARADLTWWSAKHIAVRQMPWFINRKHTGMVLSELHEAPQGGLRAAPWSDAQRGKWRVWVVEGER